jgi:hypothetical protein
MCRMESSLTFPRVVRGAETLVSGCRLVALQPKAMARRVNGYETTT